MPEFIKVKVYPSDKNPGVSKISDDKYEVRVSAPPDRGLANKEMLSRLKLALIGATNSHLYQMQIVSGTSSPNKIIKIFRREK